MVCLPRKCEHCGLLVHHYGACTCPKAGLDAIDAERAAIKERLAQLAEWERAETKRWLEENYFKRATAE